MTLRKNIYNFSFLPSLLIEKLALVVWPAHNQICLVWTHSQFWGHWRLFELFLLEQRIVSKSQLLVLLIWIVSKFLDLERHFLTHTFSLSLHTRSTYHALLFSSAKSKTWFLPWAQTSCSTLGFLYRWVLLDLSLHWLARVFLIF